MMSDNTAKLTSAVNSLPQLLEKKRLIDMHTTIATGMLISCFCWILTVGYSEVNAFVESMNLRIEYPSFLIVCAHIFITFGMQLYVTLLLN